MPSYKCKTCEHTFSRKKEYLEHMKNCLANNDSNNDSEVQETKVSKKGSKKRNTKVSKTESKTKNNKDIEKAKLELEESLVPKDTRAKNEKEKEEMRIVLRNMYKCMYCSKVLSCDDELSQHVRNCEGVEKIATKENENLLTQLKLLSERTTKEMLETDITLNVSREDLLYYYILNTQRITFLECAFTKFFEKTHRSNALRIRLDANIYLRKMYGLNDNVNTCDNDEVNGCYDDFESIFQDILKNVSDDVMKKQLEELTKLTQKELKELKDSSKEEEKLAKKTVKNTNTKSTKNTKNTKKAK